MHLESVREEITWQRVERERFIFAASLRRSPVEPVFDWRSEPARSTMFSLPCLILASPL